MASSSKSSAAGRRPADVIQWLADQRRRPDRSSAQVVEYGTWLLEQGHIQKLGDELWSALEQIAMAALDVGDIELAELCLSRLDTRFPDSSRVDTLRGMLFEARGELVQALEHYSSMMAKADGADIILSKRRVACLKAMEGVDERGGIAKATEALKQHLEVYYSDPEGWQELVDLHLEQGQLTQALSSLEELLLLVPQNGFLVLKYAETLYSAGEYATAYKAFLRVLDVGAGVERGSSAGRGGPETRALWGLRATLTQLRGSGAGAGAVSKRCGGKDGLEKIKAESMDDVEVLVTDLLLNRAYAGDGKDQATLKAARAVLSL
ncbi:unnamed protein product [Parajaminaea phylloscopi]